MRILFTPLASPSHVLPIVPMAWACRAAGHDVRVAAQPRVIDTINRCGLQAVPVGGSHDLIAEAQKFLTKRPELLRPNGRLAVLNGAPAGQFGRPWITSAEAIAPDLIEFGRWWRPDLVITDPMVYAGPLAARVLGVPVVRHLWGPDWTKAGFGMGGWAEGAPPPEWPDELVSLYESYGVPSCLDYAAGTIDPFPPSLQVPGLANRITMRPVPHNGSGTVPQWLAEPPPRPRVCVTGGTANMQFLGADGFFVPTVLAGVADLDIEVVLAIGGADRDLLGPVPPHTRVVEQLPLDLLLPSCAGLVSHGGAGGLITAAVHGVPQVVIPQLSDQPSNARLLAATGAGVALDATSLTAGDVREAVRAIVFGTGPRAAARTLQAEIRTLPAPAEVVSTLETLVR